MVTAKYTIINDITLNAVNTIYYMISITRIIYNINYKIYLNTYNILLIHFLKMSFGN